MIKIKHFYSPSYTANEWLSENPLLKLGELGIELDDNGQPSKIKIGDGINLWEHLPYINDPIYDYDELVSNEIGDVKVGDSLKDEKINDIILRMVSPFINPALSGLSNNAAGALANVAVVEIGNQVITAVEVNYNVSNPENLNSTNNIFVSAGGIFENEGLHTHTNSPLNLILAAPLAPTELTEYVIGLYALYPGGTSPTATTKISFRPSQLHGSSDNPNLIDISDESIPQGLPSVIDSRKVTDTYKGDFTFAGTGYSYMLVPDMLDPADLNFAEVTNPNQIASYSMIWQGRALIGNGTGQYIYHVYRSEFEIIFSTKMRIS